MGVLCMRYIYETPIRVLWGRRDGGYGGFCPLTCAFVARSRWIAGGYGGYAALTCSDAGDQPERPRSGWCAPAPMRQVTRPYPPPLDGALMQARNQIGVPVPPRSTSSAPPKPAGQGAKSIISIKRDHDTCGATTVEFSEKSIPPSRV